MKKLSTPKWAVVTLLAFGCTVCLTNKVFAQDSSTISSEQIAAHLSSGEFNQALNLAGQLNDRGVADQWHSKIAAAQSNSGARRGAMFSAGLIEDNQQRYDTYANLYNDHSFGGANSGDSGLGQSGNGNDAGQNAGQRGGITEADFDELMELIQETIFPESWEDAGGTGRMRPFASGVFVDSTGALKRINPDALKNWNSLKGNSGSLNWQLDSSSDLRKISLNRLEREVMSRKARGELLSDDLKYLGGIYDLQYVMVYPETGDLVIAGPAGPWRIDGEGRPVNIETGRPVLRLDDLVVCIRNAWEGNGVFGCSIDPRPENLVAVKQFLTESKLKGDAWSKKLRETLGQQDITVHGIDARTHAGQVIVEADYRMKLIGMGLEETIPNIPSYLDRVQANADGTMPPMDVVRWWFTMNYDDISSSPEADVFQLNGQAVKVLSETEFLNEQGERVHTGTSQGPTLEFAKDFTEHYEDLVTKYSIYGELQNVFDLSLAANLIRKNGLADQVGWQPTFFASPQSNTAFCYNVPMEAQPSVVETVMNDKTVFQTVGKRKLKHQILGVSGGVEFDSNDFIANVKVDESIAVDRDNENVAPNNVWHWE